MAQSAKDIQLRELKDLVNELKETTKLLRKTLEDVQKEKAAIQQERDNFLNSWIITRFGGHAPLFMFQGLTERHFHYMEI